MTGRASNASTGLQTRSGARRAAADSEPDRSALPRRGTHRDSLRKSVESIVTNDFPGTTREDSGSDQASDQASDSASSGVAEYEQLPEGPSQSFINNAATLAAARQSERKLSERTSAARSRDHSPTAAAIRRVPPHHVIAASRSSPGDDEPLQDEDRRALSQRARENRLRNGAKRPPKRRVRWTAAEEQRLLDLIQTVGCRWSELEKAGGFENSRDQQAIRDKARNMKVEYLQADRFLSPGFDGILLGKKETESVIRAGRNPNRLESDFVEGDIDDSAFSDDETTVKDSPRGKKRKLRKYKYLTYEED
ncbi:hypothetical protein F4780DRAFT_355596 [Xylariomycetidae sp. FL0641]|nr:hypothetical protein F4780DRAFT_355596 [Xylariomycetidae sp. FL0641]